MRVKQWAIAIASVVVIFGTVFVTSIMGVWKTTNTKEPAKYTSGEFAGQYDPSDIRGSYTFGEVSDLFDIPLAELGGAFGVESGKEAVFACKDLESIYVAAKAAGKEVGTSSVQLFVALYTGLPADLTAESYFPQPAQQVLLDAGKMNQEQIDYVSNHLVPLEAATDTPVSTAETEGEPLIKGSTTFNEMIALGVSKEEIETAIGAKITDTTKIIREFCTEKGLEFATVKTQIQTLVEQK